MFIVIVRRTGRRKIILNRHDRGWKLVDKIVCRQIQMSWLISNARQRVRTTFFIFKFCEIGYRGFLNKVTKQTYTQTNEKTNRQATKDKNKTKQDRDEKQIWDLVILASTTNDHTLSPSLSTYSGAPSSKNVLGRTAPPPIIQVKSGWYEDAPLPKISVSLSKADERG